MLDSYIRPRIDPSLDTLGKNLLRLGFTANIMTLIGFICGIIAIVAIMCQQYTLAAGFIMCNRLADGLDGAIARQSQMSDFGGFIDIVCDFIIYAGVVFAFGFTHAYHLPYAAFLLFSFIGPTTSFLAYAIIASKRKITTEKRSRKSFYYLGGLCEGTETATALILFCLIPDAFNIMAIIFGIMCWLTTSGRIYAAWHTFGKTPDSGAIISSVSAYK